MTRSNPIPARRRALAMAATFAAIGLAPALATTAPAPSPSPVAAPTRAASPGPVSPGPVSPSGLLPSPVSPGPVSPSGLLPSPASPGPMPPTPPAAGRAVRLYQQSCASCHGLRGEGSQRGPSLIGVGPASIDFQLSTGRMPLARDEAEPGRHDPAFSPADIDALVAYVDSFGPGGPPIPIVRPGDLPTGRELYAQHCAACHSATGMGAALTNGQIAPPLSRSTPTQVGEAIRVGPGLMPAFPASALDQRDVDAIAGYVQALQGKNIDMDRGGLRLGRVGPFTEGAVAWIIGLGLLVLVIRSLGSRTP